MHDHLAYARDWRTTRQLRYDITLGQSREREQIMKLNRTMKFLTWMGEPEASISSTEAESRLYNPHEQDQGDGILILPNNIQLIADIKFTPYPNNAIKISHLNKIAAKPNWVIIAIQRLENIDYFRFLTREDAKEILSMRELHVYYEQWQRPVYWHQFENYGDWVSVETGTPEYIYRKGIQRLVSEYSQYQTN